MRLGCFYEPVRYYQYDEECQVQKLPILIRLFLIEKFYLPNRRKSILEPPLVFLIRLKIFRDNFVTVIMYSTVCGTRKDV